MTFSYLANTGRGRKGFFQALTFTLLMVAFACTPALAGPAIPITQCGTVISQPGHYILANDLTCSGVTPVSPINGSMPMGSMITSATGMLASHSASSGDGIIIISDNVDLMLDFHFITGDSGSNFGISVGVGVASGNSHVHIIGPGFIQGFGAGIVLEQVSHSSVSDVNTDFDLLGIAIAAGDCSPACPSTKNDVQGNFAAANVIGFFLAGANDNTLRDNTAGGGDAVGILIAEGTGNDLRGNFAGDNPGVGILVAAGATNNDLTNNNAQNDATVDLEDDNLNCDSNTWKRNIFGTASQTCIQ